MRTTSARAIARLVMLTLVFTGCSASRQFTDGLAAISGKGGTIARQDAYATTVTFVRQFGAGQPRPQWQVPFVDDATDFMEVVAPDRLLIGTSTTDAYLGMPSRARVLLVDASSGRTLYEAPRLALPRSRLQLLSSDSLVAFIELAEGKKDVVSKLTALDASTGAVKWRAEVRSLLASVRGSGNRLYVLAGNESSGGGQARALEARDLSSGAVAWSAKLQPVAATRSASKVAEPVMLLADDRHVMVIDQRVSAYTAADGALAWRADEISPASDSASAQLLGRDLLLWGPRSATLVDGERGVIRWRRVVQEGGVKLVASPREGGPLVRVQSRRVANAAGASVASDVVSTLDPATGEPGWSADANGVIVSPLVVEQGIVMFATEDTLIGIDAANGKRRFASVFPPLFRDGSPTRAAGIGLADRLFVQGSRLFVARENGGLLAFELPSGTELWFSRPRRGMPAGTDAYPAERRFAGLESAMQMGGAKPSATAKQPALAGFTTASRTGPLVAAQQQFGVAMRQTRKRQERELNASRAYRYDFEPGGDLMAFGNYGAGLAASLLDVSAAVGVSLRNSAIEGLVSRQMMLVEIAFDLHDRAFTGGGYYVRPSDDIPKGRGFTVVELATGRQADVNVAPIVLPVMQYALDMGGFIVDPQSGRLVTAAIGMDTTRYEAQVKGKIRYPRPSLMSFDLSALPFKSIPLSSKAASSF